MAAGAGKLNHGVQRPQQSDEGDVAWRLGWRLSLVGLCVLAIVTSWGLPGGTWLARFLGN